MSKYTTGELAKLCGVTVRTVQYYDNRGILIPSELSEGGRRLYSDEDLKRLKVICFLRELDLSINTIDQLLREEHPEKIIDLLLWQQEVVLTDEIDQRREKLNKLAALRRGLKSLSNFSVESICDIADIMENKKKLRKLRWTVVGMAVLAEAVELGAILLGIYCKTWWPVAAGMPIFLGLCAWVVWYYYDRVSYQCPECNRVFKPAFRQFMFSSHTPTTRKLTCTACGHRGFCVETAAKPD
jgi:DNA-binding transcriptional MerR regulator/DNA-directed RNA polymerase subunit RPC12/RpoP